MSLSPEWDRHACQYLFRRSKYDTYFINATRYDQEGIPESWALYHDGFVLDKNLEEFIYEPLPSNRTEEFLASTRFDTKEAAYEAMLRHWDLQYFKTRGLSDENNV